MPLANAIRPAAETSVTVNWCQQLEAHQANCEPSPLDEVRRRALAELAAAGRLPGRKDEHWKYFSLQALESLQPELNLPGQAHDQAHGQDAGLTLPASIFAEADACRLPVRIGHRFDVAALQHGCIPQGLRLLSLEQAVAEAEILAGIQAMLASENLQGAGRVFQALNTAALGTALDNTLVIHVASGTDVGRLHIDWLPADDDEADAESAWLDNCRLIILVEEGARLQLLESFPAPVEGACHSPSVLNQVTQVKLAGNSGFDYLRVQMCAASQHLFQFGQIHQDAGSVYRYTGFELGGGLVRNELVSQLKGREAKADLAAAFIGNGESIIDHHLLVDHLAPHCRSEQIFRGVLGGRSKGVFNGKALIRQGADGSSVRQSNANLLLSSLAEMNTKPELEIYADEVEASHGATVGQLDEQALFYLQTRGLTEDAARRMLTGAFCRSIGARLSDRQLVEQIEALLDEAMPGMEEASEVTA